MDIDVIKYLQLLDDNERRRLKEYAERDIDTLSPTEIEDMANLVEKAMVGVELGELDILGSKPIGLRINPNRPE